MGDRDVELSTTVTAAMLEVHHVAAVRRRKVTYACKLLCVELHQSRSSILTRFLVTFNYTYIMAEYN